MISVIVIGKGPAGISAAVYAKRTGLDVTVIGKDRGALQKSEKIENYYGFAEPIKGADLIDKGIAQAKRLGITVLDDEVLGIEFSDHYTVKTAHDTYEAQALILATGSPRQLPRIKGIREFEGKGISYCAVCDAFFYRKKKVAVLGCCDYAMSEARELLNVTDDVTIITNGAPARGNIPAQAKVVEKEVAEVGGTDRVAYLRFTDGSELALDGLFIAYGTAGSADFALKLGVMTDGNDIIVDQQMATNLPGFYAAGDCVGGIYQIVKAVDDGARAGMAASKYVRALNIKG